MSLISRTVWYVENHWTEEISLTGIAEVLGVSHYHLARAFGAATGMTVMSYVRARRLSEAARRLAAGAPDILSLAIECGYGSHEAFSRAFRDHFGITPDSARSLRDLSSLQLMEPLLMTTDMTTPLPAPRLDSLPAMHMVGLTRKFTPQTRTAIPGLWQEFAPFIGSVPGQVTNVAYGICSATGEEEACIDYSCAVEIEAGAPTPAGLVRIMLEPHTYRVFPHDGHVSELHQTYVRALGTFHPDDEWECAQTPDIERYSTAFNPETGFGGMEIWIPLARRTA